MWAIIWNNQSMFWEKDEEAFLCYRIKDFFKKLLIIGQSSEKNNIAGIKAQGRIEKFSKWSAEGAC